MIVERGGQIVGMCRIRRVFFVVFAMDKVDTGGDVTPLIATSDLAALGIKPRFARISLASLECEMGPCFIPASYTHESYVNAKSRMLGITGKQIL